MSAPSDMTSPAPTASAGSRSSFFTQGRLAVAALFLLLTLFLALNVLSSALFTSTRLDLTEERRAEREVWCGDRCPWLQWLGQNHVFPKGELIGTMGQCDLERTFSDAHLPSVLQQETSRNDVLALGWRRVQTERNHSP